MILHIPHAAKTIPEPFKEQFVLSADELAAELVLMTDSFTDELFALPETTTVGFPVSRLFVDVERFPSDAEEPMSKVGMGVLYTRTAHGKQLRRPLCPEEQSRLVSQYYAPHHQALLEAVNQELAQYGTAVIVDCHSFPSQPLPCDRDQTVPRPAFCIGTDSFHTPEGLVQIAALHLKALGYTVGLNHPYAGTLTPLAYYQTEPRVLSIMIEINRGLYMDERSGMKNTSFDLLKTQVLGLLGAIRETAYGNTKFADKSLPG